jgi:arylsulfatase A-like enzyme
MRFPSPRGAVWLALAISLLPPWPAVAAARPPNVVVILADDFGVGNVRAHYPDNKIATPALDRLVREGMSFTDAHSASAVCTPTRYALLTGRYAWRTRLQEWVLAVYEPPLIAAERPTVASFLRTRGYATACIGKWHLGWEWPGPQPGRMTDEQNGQRHLSWDFSRPIGAGPVTRGFDHYFGPDVPNFPPFTFIEDDRIVIPPTGRYAVDAAQGVVLPRAFAENPAAPGWRFDEILPELTRRAVAHVRARAREGRPFFLYLPLTSPHEPVSPSAAWRGRSGIAPVADFIMETDWAVGEVVRAIDEAGAGPDTLVLFSADNGHSGYTGWKELVAAGHQPSGPFRGRKGDVWEGGHRVPLVARWSGRVAAGATHAQPVCLTDLFATVAELAGAPLPAAAAEDSFSFAGALLGRPPATPPRRALINHSNPGEFAYREGPWKLVLRNQDTLAKSRGQPRIQELYNLEADRAETTDVAASNPAVVRRLRAALEAAVAAGSLRGVPGAANDTLVRVDVTQERRWAAPSR